MNADERKRWLSERWGGVLKALGSDLGAVIAEPLTGRGWRMMSGFLPDGTGDVVVWLTDPDECPICVTVEVESRVPQEAMCACGDCEDDFFSTVILGEWKAGGAESLSDWMVRMDVAARAHREGER